MNIPSLYLRAAVWLLLAAVLLVVVRNAWLSDDIYITFRTLDNFLHGEGLVWNTHERVQTFTHPLWLFTLAPFFGLLDHAYQAAMVTSILFTALTLLALFRLFPKPQVVLSGLALLACSRAFIDFSTSGLENPLSNLLLVLFAGTFWKRGEMKNGLLKLSLLAALLLLNRLDHLVLVAPPLAMALFEGKFRQNIRPFLLGFAPLFLWEAFSIVYYGFPFPNTFYAKAMTGLPKSTLIGQGLLYLQDSLTSDFVSLPVILLATVGVIWKGGRQEKVLLAGLWTYLAYVVWVGGDFMSGRFVSTPFLLAVLLLLRLEVADRWRMAATGMLLAVSLFHPYHPFYTGKSYYDDRRGNERALYPHGIVDEKGMAWQRSSLLAMGEDSPLLVVERERGKWTPEPKVEVQVAVGWYGYAMGPTAKIVDELALTDPLLARLPALEVPYWRIGHFFRRVPKGYVEGLESGSYLLYDKDLDLYHEHLCWVTQGPIFSSYRWKQIFNFNFGLHNHLIDHAAYRNPTEAEYMRFPDLVED